MKVGKALYHILSNNSNVSTLITSDGNTRIFPSAYNFPTNVKLPYITYQMVTDTPNNTKNGVSTYDYVVVQVSIYHNTYSEMITLADHVRTALDYTSGTFNGVIVNKIFFDSQAENYDESTGSKGLFGVAQDYRFNINR